MRAAVKKFGMAFLVFYGTLVAALYFLQREMIYVPSRHRPEPAKWHVPEMRAVTLKTDDNLDLLAWWRPPVAATGPVIVYFHGNGGHLGLHASRMRIYLDKGWGVLVPTWRGYSGNPGSPSEEGLYRDGRAALRFVAGEKIAPERVVLYGHSLGSGVAVQMATEFAEGAVVLESPLSSVADVAKSRFPFLPIDLLLKDRFDSRQKVHNIGAPLLLLHGLKDGVIPVEFGKLLFSAAVAPKQSRFIGRGGHNNLYQFGAGNMVLEFVKSLKNKDNKS